MKVKTIISCFMLSLLCGSTHMQAQTQTLACFASPNGQVKVDLTQNSTYHFLTIKNASSQQLTRITLGFNTQTEDFFKSMTTLSVSEPEVINVSYDNIHGKTSHVSNEANGIVAHLANENNTAMDVEIRAYNDGVAFRYSLPTTGNRVFTNEQTSYDFATTAKRWLMQLNSSYEGDFPYQEGGERTGNWGYPCLFEVRNTYVLISEADANRMYCVTHLNNGSGANRYKVCLHEGSTTQWSGTWTSPWRVVIVGSLATVTESTLVEDVSTPTTMTNTSWIKPGSAAWVYWAYNHGTSDYQICKQYVDLAVEMGWPYVLFDWEWEQMGNGGNLEGIVSYARSKGIKPMIWYHSNDGRMRDRNRRISEFQWLNRIGVVGIKVDFFESDSQETIQYHIDLLEDAARYKILVNFHGCTIPRGWTRTYPHLMSTEAVFGGEQYNNGGYMTTEGARINCTLPFTRNVIGPMDYTPVAFTNSQHPHTTSFAHELALSVVFESGIQHWADRPEGFYNLPLVPRKHMETVPTAWDETRLVSGNPGKSIIIARRSGTRWYVGGLQGQNKVELFKVPLNFLDEGDYTATLICDGSTVEKFNYSCSTQHKDDQLSVKCLARGGFVLTLEKNGTTTAKELETLQKQVAAALTEAEQHTGNNTGFYHQDAIDELKAALAESQKTDANSTGQERYNAYQTLLVAYSLFQENGRVTGGLFNSKDKYSDVTTKYLLEATNFSRSDGKSTRFGTPANWTVSNFKIQQTNNNGIKNGIDNYPGTNCLMLGVWEGEDGSTSVNLKRAMIYREVTLPAGRYYFGAAYNAIYHMTNAYMFAAKNPVAAAQTETNAIAFYPIGNAAESDNFYGLQFTLPEETTLYLGWNADLTLYSQQEMRVKTVTLRRYINDGTAIENVQADATQNSTSRIFDLQGRQLSANQSHQPGIYILQNNNRTYKVYYEGDKF